MLTVGYTSQHDPSDHRAWSGTVNGIAKALRSSGAKVHTIGPLHTPVTVTSSWRKLSAAVRSGRSLRDRDPRVVQSWGRQADVALAWSTADCVLSPSTLPLAYSRTNLPRAVWIDATFAGMVEEYEATVRDGGSRDPDALGRIAAFAGLDRATVRNGNAIEARAFEQIDAAIFSSTWARDSAIEAYDLDPGRAHVVPFGAHVDLPDESVVDELIDARPEDCIELLFIGVIWEGKGGPIALETARLLNASGIPTRLTVIGVTPTLSGPAPEWLECTGVLDKGTSAGRTAFERALARAHILVFPTRFDAYGLAIAEANAYGVPALAPRHAGPATIIRDDHNGELLERNATAEEYHDAVIRMWSDSAAYRALARRAHQECRERLSWATASQHVLDILADIAPVGGAQASARRANSN